MTSPTYDGQTLFISGPARCEVAGVSLRFAEHPTAQSHGANIVAQGREARRITQTGALLADTLDSLEQQRKRIEAYVDGMARILVDELGRSWPSVVMLAFEPASPTRLGTRWQMRYRVRYQQVRP